MGLLFKTSGMYSLGLVIILKAHLFFLYLLSVARIEH